MTARLVSVAVPVPFLEPLTYLVPSHLPLPPVGARVRVPVGSRVLTGCVVDSAHETGTPAHAELKPVERVLDEEPYLPEPVVALCRWVADYYMAGLGDTLVMALPPGARGADTSAFRTRRVARLTAHGLSLAGAHSAAAPSAAPVDAAHDTSAAADGMRLTPRQQRAIETLADAPAGLPLRDLRERGVTPDVMTRLAARGIVSIAAERDERDPFLLATSGPRHDPGRPLTGEQEACVAQLAAMADAGSFGVALLHGVTGSGKTEVYLRLADRVRRGGRQILLLVPEIALTPSMAALFRSAFGNRVAVQHSGLSGGERHDQWQRIRRGEVDLVIGTRSAVFAPLTRLGLVVVDEEHDSSYKQEEAPRYHGRDVAIVRASREGALVVLGSATPSIETFHHARRHKYARVTLERRVLDRPLASVRVVNMRDEYAASGPDVVVSRALAEAIGDRLDRRDQVLVLLNRRGYATAVFCRQCGDTFECPNCSVSLTIHAVRPAATPRTGAGDMPRRWRARCHYCNYTMVVPAACRACASPYLEQAGFGTEKVVEHLQVQFPAARIGRIDRDAVRRRGALAALLSRFADGSLDILVGTQMIAKGHDFPRVTLVGVVSADVGLGLADFRAAERTFQLLTQVAGRAGRGERPGEAIVQTIYPDHYSIRLACGQAYPAFFDKEVEYRRAMHYPPYVALVNVLVRGRTTEDAMQTAAELVHALGPAATTVPFQTLGPAPAPLRRLRGEHRVQFFLKGARRAGMRQALQAVLAARPALRRRVTVDVDPVSVL